MYSYFVEDNFLADKIYRSKDTGKFMHSEMKSQA
jgi:hypothetical protein